MPQNDMHWTQGRPAHDLATLLLRLHNVYLVKYELGNGFWKNRTGEKEEGGGGGRPLMLQASTLMMQGPSLTRRRLQNCVNLNLETFKLIALTQLISIDRPQSVVSSSFNSVFMQVCPQYGSQLTTKCDNRRELTQEANKGHLHLCYMYSSTDNRQMDILQN